MMQTKAKILLILFVAVFLVLNTTKLQAKEASEVKSVYVTVSTKDSLKYLHNRASKKFFVKIDDQVTGGCWTSLKSAKTAVELELKRSNRLADPESPFDNLTADYLWIAGFGGKTELGLCIVSVDIDIYFQVSANLASGFDSKYNLMREVLCSY